MADTRILYANPVLPVKALIEATVGVPVHVQVPKTRPSKFVMVELAGGSDASPVHERAALIVDSWGPSVAEAQDLAQLVRSHLRAIRNDVLGGVLVYQARPAGGVVWMPDLDSNTPRFRQNWTLSVRGKPA